MNDAARTRRRGLRRAGSVTLGLAAAAVAGSLAAAGLAWAATATTDDVSDTSTGTSDDPAVESPGTDGSADSGDDWAEPGGAVTRSDDKPHATSGGS